MTQTLAILLLFICFSCGQIVSGSVNNNNKNDTAGNKLVPFELTVEDADYSMSQTFIYKISANKIEIFSRSDINIVGMRKGENLDTVYKADLEGNATLKKLSNINLDNLKDGYFNHCIMDGSQVTVTLNKDGKSKTVHLSNYYQSDIGLVIELINTLTPKKYKIWYDKDILLKGQKDCE
jgi:hypothetical protein